MAPDADTATVSATVADLGSFVTGLLGRWDALASQRRTIGVVA
jgi:hypothetical protein